MTFLLYHNKSIPETSFLEKGYVRPRPTSLNGEASDGGSGKVEPLPPLTLRLVPELNLAALTKRQDRQLLLLYYLKAIDLAYYHGTGRLGYDHTIELLLNYYAPATLFRVLALGDGIYWDKPKKQGARIKIYALSRVAEYLDTFKLSRYVEIKASELLPGKGARAMLYNTGAYKPELVPVHPISRQSLEEKTGIGRRQQQRYDAQANTSRAETMVKYFDKEINRYRHVLQDLGSYKIKRQIGNRYHSKAEVSRRGQLRKISTSQKAKSESFLTAGANPGSHFVKRYYNSVKALVLAKKQGKAGNSGYVPFQSNSGVYLWIAAY